MNQLTIRVVKIVNFLKIYLLSLRKIKQLENDLEVANNYLLDTITTEVELEEEISRLKAQCADVNQLNNRLKERAEIFESYSFSGILSLDKLKKKWLESILRDIEKDSGKRCGSSYEVYEERRQSALAEFLSINEEAFTEEESKQFKIKSDFCDDFKPYSEYDLFLKSHASIHEVIQRAMA